MSKHSLTNEQELATQSARAPLSLTASAGSGKTTVLVKRYCDLLDRGIDPSEIICLTFTTDAANEMKERVVAQLSDSPINSDAFERKAFIGTLHSYCYQLLNRYGSTLGYLPVDSIISPFEEAKVFEHQYQAWLNDLEPDTLKELLQFYNFREIKDVMKLLLQRHYEFSRYVSTLVSKEEDSLTETTIVKLLFKAAKPLIESISTHFLARGQYRFDDLETLSLLILEQKPEVLNELRSKQKAILVDEFQDTSPNQWSLLKHLIGQDTHKLFIVGDPKQSIYRFRNADVSLFNSVSELIHSQGGFKDHLTHNFRTRPKLLEEINTLSKSLFEGTSLFDPMLAGLPDQEATFNILGYDGTLSKQQSLEDEVSRVVSQIKRLTSNGVSLNEIAILFRVTDRMSQFRDALDEQGIPANFSQSGRLFNHYDVLDIYHFLKALYDPMDDYYLSAFLLSPYVGWSYQQLWTLKESSPSDLFHSLIKSKQLDWFVRLIESGEWNSQKCLETLFKYSKHPPPESASFEVLLKNSEFEDWGLGEVTEALENWKSANLYYSLPKKVENAERVALLTVHGAKGLEFEHVFIVDNLRQPPKPAPMIWWNAQGKPGLRYRENNEMVNSADYENFRNIDLEKDLQESQRILYVAITRAKHSLSITLPKGVKKFPKGSWAETIYNAVEPF